MTQTTDAPIERVLPRLQRTKERKPGEWVASCPCSRHERGDQRPSLSVSVGQDGTVLLRCWSGGCTVQEITAAIGLTVADLFPGAGRRNGHTPAHGPKTYPSLDDAIAAIGRGITIDHPGAQYRDRWHYQEAKGDDAPRRGTLGYPRQP